MTRRILYWNLGLTVFLLCAYTCAALAIKFTTGIFESHSDVYSAMRDFIPVLMGLAATYVADTLQRRGQFIAALRDLWYEMVRAKGQVVGFLNDQSQGGEGYWQAWIAQSNVIDMVRGVYKNVGETPKLVGFRPFEPLVSMLLAFEKVDPRKAPKTNSHASVVEEIEEYWNALREVFLEEFSLVEPEQSILVEQAHRRKSAGASVVATLQKRAQSYRYRRRSKG